MIRRKEAHMVAGFRIIRTFLAIIILGTVAFTHQPALAEQSLARAGRADAKPPLPFEQPLVGPVIKPSNQDDVDLKSTAFIPTSLDELSETEMPDTDEKWIRVDLSEQVVIAYEGRRPVRGFLISSGLPGTPTVTGEFRIRTKVVSQTMSGGSPELGTYYNLPNVQWVQYFHAGYSFHGTYWHNNFGNPMSHGCVNMTNVDAKWLFDWAGPAWDGKSIWYHSTKSNPGTLVIVHA